MMYAHNYGKGENAGMHKMPNGKMMSDTEMAKHMKKKMPRTMHPREAMKMMKRTKASQGYSD